MKYTDKLGLPIWNEPETDVFDIKHFNKGMQAIDDIVINILNKINDLVIGDTQVDLDGYVKEEVFREYIKQIENKADKEEVEEISSQLDTKVSIDVNRFVTSRHFNLYSKLMNFVLVNGCVLGDSIAEGGSGSWHRLLTEKLKQDGYNVGGFREHGVGGTTALNILQAVSYDAIQMANTNSKFIEHRKGYPYNYDYWLICSGRNDSSGKVDLKTYEKILRATLRTAKRNQIDVILIIEPPAIDMITGEIIDGYVSDDVNQYETYSELARKIGNSEGVSIVDMQKYFKFKSLTESLIPYYADGVHYSTLGQQEMMNMVYECLTRTPEENFKPNYFKIPQANYYPISAFTPSSGTYTYETYTPISSVSRLWHLQDKDASADKYIKVRNGNSVTFEFLNNKLDFISVNFLRKLTTGTIKITSGGVTVASGLRGMNNNMAEDSVYALCTRTDFPARGSVTITAENGDLAITGVSTLQPILTTRHKEFNGIIQGTPSNMPISGTTFKNLYTVGDCFEFEWIGNNVGINIAKGPEMGIVDITTDGVTETVDLYQSNYTIWNIYSLLKNLEYGKHKTRITVKDKNGSSKGRNTPIREIHVYSSSSSDGSIATLINNKSDVYLTNVYNLINLENYLLNTNPNMTGWSKVDNKILTIESETMKILETKLK